MIQNISHHIRINFKVPPEKQKVYYNFDQQMRIISNSKTQRQILVKICRNEEKWTEEKSKVDTKTIYHSANFELKELQQPICNNKEV